MSNKFRIYRSTVAGVLLLPVLSSLPACHEQPVRHPIRIEDLYGWWGALNLNDSILVVQRLDSGGLGRYYLLFSAGQLFDGPLSWQLRGDSLCTTLPKLSRCDDGRLSPQTAQLYYTNIGTRVTPLPGPEGAIGRWRLEHDSDKARVIILKSDRTWRITGRPLAPWLMTGGGVSSAGTWNVIGPFLCFYQDSAYSCFLMKTYGGRVLRLSRFKDSLSFVAAPPGLGDTVSTSGHEFRVVVNATQTADGFNPILPRRPGFTLFAADVTLVCQDDPCFLLSGDLVLRDDNGFEYTRQIFSQKDPGLPSDFERRMSRGEKLRGWITFQIPKKATGLSLHINGADIQLR